MKEEPKTLRLVVELSESDLDHYRRRLQEAWQRCRDRDEGELVQAARKLLERMREAGLSETVKRRLDDLGDLISMLEDEEWGLEGEDREKITSVMSYFVDPMDMIPDDMPGLGYLDDALMTELIVRELRHDLDGYRDFRRYREQREESGEQAERVSREDWLAAKRRQLFLRIKRRREERRRHGSTSGPTPPILQYRS